MKLFLLPSTFIIALSFASCHNTNTANAANDSLKNEVAQLHASLDSLKQTSAASAKNAPAATKDIQTDPESVMQAIFDAAKTGDFSLLPTLCDPSGSGDGDTKAICNVANEPPSKQQEFKDYFRTGQITGAPEVYGDVARVKFNFGPDGTKSEVMNMVRVGGKWYLSSF